MKPKTMRELYEKFNQGFNSEPSTIEEIILAYIYNKRYNEISVSNLFADNYMKLVSADQYIQLSRIFSYVCEELSINEDTIFEISLSGGWLRPKKIDKRINVDYIVYKNSKTCKAIEDKILECESRVIEEGYRSELSREYFYFIPKGDQDDEN